MNLAAKLEEALADVDYYEGADSAQGHLETWAP
jgi:hypothetical protein